MRITLPCGAEANVSADIKQETVEALDEMMRAVKEQFSPRMPMPTTEDAVAWAEEAQKIAVVLRELADKFDGIDNGRCTTCRVGHRLWKVPGKVKGPCDYELCLSHRISEVLEHYESPSEELLEQMKQHCLKELKA